MWTQRRSQMEVWALVYAGIIELESADEEIATLQNENKKMTEVNKQIQNQLQQVKLSAKQSALVNLSREKFISELGSFHIDAFSDITFVERLGEGSFGQCFLGIYKGQEVAIKVMRHGLVTNDGLKAFKREIQMLHSVSHDNVVAFRGFSMMSQLVM